MLWIPTNFYHPTLHNIQQPAPFPVTTVLTSNLAPPVCIFPLRWMTQFNTHDIQQLIICYNYIYLNGFLYMTREMTNCSLQNTVTLALTVFRWATPRMDCGQLLSFLFLPLPSEAGQLFLCRWLSIMTVMGGPYGSGWTYQFSQLSTFIFSCPTVLIAFTYLHKGRSGNFLLTN